jgi:hypothetical protein
MRCRVWEDKFPLSTLKKLIGHTVDLLPSRCRCLRSMAGENVILDTSAIKLKTHVRAAIVKRKHATNVIDDKDRAMAAAHDESPFIFSSSGYPRTQNLGMGHVHNNPLGGFNMAFSIRI